MKHKLLSLWSALLIAAVMVSCSAPRHFYQLEDVKGVTMVYTSSLLLNLTGGVLSKVSGVDFKKALEHVGSVRVILADDYSAASKAKSVVNYQVRHMHATPLFAAGGASKHKGTSGIYVTSDGPNTFNNVILIFDNGFKYQAIFLEGKLTMADIQSLNVELSMGFGNDDDGGVVALGYGY